MENSEMPPSQLKGTLLKKTTAEEKTTETPLRGTLIEKTKITSDIKHASSWELDLNSGEVVKYGNLLTEGFEATANNTALHKDAETGATSFGQDAFAVNAGRSRFVVTDGMGGAGDQLATAFIAKFMADQVAVYGADLLFNESLLSKTYQTAKEIFKTKFGREIRTSLLKSSLVAGAATTTVSCVEIEASKTDGAYTARVTVIGDSPVFVLDSDGTVIKSYGEDTQRGSTDSPLGFAIGITRDGSPLIPQKGVIKNNAQISDETISISAGQRIVIGSDYFSDTYLRESKGDFSIGRVQDFIDLSPEVFGEKTKSMGKSDDATLVVVDPATLFAT
ncbi:MAG: hypothetical protein ABIO02_04605 [Patescibacteria group bacterium]